MNERAAALGYLIARTVRNRVVRQAARVRQPRFALAVLFGLLYLWLLALRPGGTGRSAATPGGALATMAAVGLLATVVAWWLGKGTATALAFQPAEVQFLFTAPFGRRTLLAYKMARTQLVLLINALVFALLLRRWGVTLGFPLRLVTAWGVFAVLTTHRLAIGLVETPPVRGGRAVARVLVRAAGAAAVALLAVSVGPTIVRLGQTGFAPTLGAIGHALTVAPASWVMAPFRILVAPAFVSTTAAWPRAFLPVLGIIAVNVAWVLGMHVEFEETAASASTELAKRRAALLARRAGRGAVLRPVRFHREWLPLAPAGPPAVAIAWKNTIAFARTGAMRALIFFVVFTVIASRLMAAKASGDSETLAGVFAGMAGMVLILGPRLVRNDLRQDLLNLALLKSYPLGGSALVAAEIASPAIVLTLFQLAMAAIAAFSLPPHALQSISTAQLGVLLVVVPLVLFALNVVAVGIHNGIALYFPGWVRLGPESGGVEATGQNLLVVVGSMLALLLALILPAAAGAVALIAGAVVWPALRLASAALAATAVLCAEAWFLVAMLGRAFDRLEVDAVRRPD